MQTLDVVEIFFVALSPCIEIAAMFVGLVSRETCKGGT